jgi:hypothetical protein
MTNLDVRAQLFEFFSELKDRNVIQSVRASLGEELAHLLGMHSQANKIKEASYFKNFDQNKPKVGAAICTDIRDVLPLVQKLRLSQTDVREIYERKFTGSSFDVHDTDRSLHRYKRKSADPLDASSPLVGDYILYRTEIRRTSTTQGVDKRTVNVSRMFYRFYVHQNMHLRVMGLPIVYKDRYLGLRAWVVDHEHELLSIGHVVDRTQADKSREAIYGGLSTLPVKVRKPEKYTIYGKDKDGQRRILGAPALHFRSLPGQDTSMSQGYLVRCQGLENMGGSAEDSQEQRFHKIKALQDRLTSEFRSELTVAKAANNLSGFTGFTPSVFFGKSGNSPKGLLVNQPFQEVGPQGINAIGPMNFGLNNTPTSPQRKNDRARPLIINP